LLKEYKLRCKLNNPKLGDSYIKCVAWAPLSGRPYHYIAAGSHSGLITIWKV